MRATAYGVPINTRAGLAPGKSAKSFEARQGRRQNPTPSFGVPQRTAKHHLSLQHTAHYTLHNALRPLPPTFVSSTDPSLQHIRLARLNYCCKPPLLKVRLSIRGALNPLYPASAGPGHHAALHCTAHTLTPWPRLPGCRRIAASVCQVLDCQNPALSQSWHLCLRMACCRPKPNTGCGN